MWNFNLRHHDMTCSFDMKCTHIFGIKEKTEQIGVVESVGNKYYSQEESVVATFIALLRYC